MPRSKPDPSRDPAYIEDMLTASRAVMRFVEGRTRQEYGADLLLRSAVERQVEIIGEAARLVSRLTREANPHIPWRPIQAQRHRLAHEYGEIDDDIIWEVATIHAPALVPKLEALLKQYGANPQP